ncbi:uncharacterized protein LOC127516167 isoform X2 [Ctenopharyngodon idella]|uniref:uncharacterized protein LOC127516167 isoform X2 n=1 Tax=Ctenopharyngodon idella TaxID=7959 RepID=UPI0022315572|nr:uncharacterized protein LOC127516167 isoform X2 [Ctenopharyngodon idella]
MWMFGFLLSLLGTVAIHATTNNLQENIAIKGKAVQSSTFYYESNVATDDDNVTCTHTETETNPWWRLDLKSSKSIRDVTVTNRIDCCPEQIDGAEIRIGNSLENDGNNNPICSNISGIPAGGSVSYSCSGMEGRYVNVVIPGDSKNLTLCEVKVYGTDNVKLNGNSVQSSIFQYWNAERAVDGIKIAPGIASFCTHTKEEKNPWWRLDLLDIYYVSAVTITGRADRDFLRINGAEIRIGKSLDSDGNKNPRCAVIQNIPGVVSYNYSFPHMEGRYVNVIIPGDKNVLSLCEVEVYGSLTVRKNFVRMKFVSTSDPENDKLLYQLQSALALRGITDVKMSWTKLPQRRQKCDVEEGLCPD